jgi:hypothetical protein
MYEDLNGPAIMARERRADFLREAKQVRLANMARSAQPARDRPRVNLQMVGLGSLFVSVLAIWMILIVH